MRRRAAALVLVVLLLSATALAAVTASAADANVAIQSVERSVDDPAPGESFTLEVEVANLASSSGAVTLTDVYVRRKGSTDEYARITDVGSIAAGSSLTVPLTLSLDDPGGKRLVVRAVYRDEDGDSHRLNYPLYVDVERPDEALLSLSGLDPVAGDSGTMNVTVSNGDTAALSNVRLELTGGATVRNPERVNASLAAGTQATHTYRLTFPNDGEHTLNATLTYTTGDRKTRTVHRETTVDVADSDVNVDLTATARAANGSSGVRVTLAQYGNVELNDVRLAAVVDGETVARARTPDVPAAGTRTARFDGSDLSAGNVTVVARFDAAGDRRTARTALSYSPTDPSNLVLTGVEIGRRAGTLTLSGDAANVGSADAQSVLVDVVGTGNVSGAAPNGEYFVGTVETSEFATFELTASAPPDAERVPVRISYSVDGERVSRVVSLDVGIADSVAPAAGGEAGTRGPNDESPGGGFGGGPPVLLLVAALAAVALVVIGYRWRTR